MYSKNHTWVHCTLVYDSTVHSPKHRNIDTRSLLRSGYLCRNTQTTEKKKALSLYIHTGALYLYFRPVSPISRNACWLHLKLKRQVDMQDMRERARSIVGRCRRRQRHYMALESRNRCKVGGKNLSDSNAPAVSNVCRIFLYTLIEVYTFRLTNFSEVIHVLPCVIQQYRVSFR